MSSYDLILASQSPRRHDFISKLGFTFKAVSPDIDESAFDGEAPYDHVLRLSRQKCAVVHKNYPDDVVLAADTIVCIDNKILGKPRNRDDAVDMLTMLSGRTHKVLTAVCAARGEIEHSFVTETSVTFAKLSHELILEYVKSGESDDKSGAYAVQGLAAMFVLEVNGSVSSVVGLPLAQTRELLEKFGLFFRYKG